MKVAPTSGHFDLLDECAHDACPVCTLVERRVQHLLETINYETAIDPDVLGQIIATQGWCAQHAEWWLSMANVLPTAVIYQAVLKSIGPVVSKDLPASSEASGWSRLRNAKRSLFPARKRCLACDATDDSERELLATLMTALNDSTFANAYLGSHGLCLPHYAKARGLEASDRAKTLLRERAEQTIAAFQNELAMIIRHHDYRFQAEPIGAERGAQNRAVRWIAGSTENRRPRR